MKSSVCPDCDMRIDDTNTRCTECEHRAVMACNNQQLNAGSTEEHIQRLISYARQSQHVGDLATALRYAREALALREDCSTTHALLGYLYEQQGDDAASRYHFQAALQVSHLSAGCENILPEVTPARTIVRQPQSGVMMLVLIGCVLFSGLAAVLAFRPSKHTVEQSTVLQVPSPRVRLTTTPRWTWTVPSPVAPSKSDVTPVITNTTTPSDDTVNEKAASTTVIIQHDTDSHSQSLPIDTSPRVLGPSANAAVVTRPDKPSLEAADQAYFRGEYDRAINLYEAIIDQEKTPNPRLYQDLAWCYQQLGNSQEASVHLEKAVQGYRAVLETDPDNATTQQALQSCTAALRTLLNSRDKETTAP